MKDAWFPKNYQLSKGMELKNLCECADDWQIYYLKSKGKLLIVTPSLFSYWEKSKLISRADFSCVLFNDFIFYYFYSGDECEISTLTEARDFVSLIDGLSYALALKETRKLLPEKTLKNGLFVERISRILPMPDEIECIPDSILLGTWLTGGMEIAATSTRRMLQVQPLLGEADLERIISAAGISLQSEVVTKRSNVSLNIARSVSSRTHFALPGRKELESFLVDNVIELVEHPDDYAAMNIGFPGAFILQGPPGCGKTYAVEKLVEYLDWPVYYIESGSIGSTYIHETSKKVAEIFKDAMAHAPSVVVIDEMESFLSTRSQSSEGATHHKEEIAEFLRKIPEAAKNRVLVVGMTNMIESIDPAIRRRGRFDHIIEVGMPSFEEIKQVLHVQLEALPHEDDIDEAEVAERLVGMPMSDVSFAIREAARLTAKSHLRKITKEILDLSIDKLTEGRSDTGRTIGFHA